MEQGTEGGVADMRESGSARDGRRCVPLGAIGLTLALAASVAGIAWAVGLDETGVEVAPPSSDTLRPAATTAPAPAPAGFPPARP
ncbi:hypothetical protein ACFXPZ_07170 [Streptomyces sp. NPDC059101]|uniref:hypothetical protein n=1 Tax=unclassified Streptomyces TaxID=2593676 RepID=UPI0033D7546B